MGLLAGHRTDALVIVTTLNSYLLGTYWVSDHNCYSVSQIFKAFIISLQTKTCRRQVMKTWNTFESQMWTNRGCLETKWYETVCTDICLTLSVWIDLHVWNQMEQCGLWQGWINDERNEYRKIILLWIVIYIV